jgi:hypothetical protein
MSKEKKSVRAEMSKEIYIKEVEKGQKSYLKYLTIH